MLLEDLQDHSRITTPDTRSETWEKGHGRKEQRKAKFSALEAIALNRKS